MYILYRRNKTKELEFLNERDIHTIRQAQKERNPEETARKLEENHPLCSLFFPGISRKVMDNSRSALCALRKGRLPKEEQGRLQLWCQALYPMEKSMPWNSGNGFAACGVSSAGWQGHRFEPPAGRLMGKGHTYAVLGLWGGISVIHEHIGLYVDILEEEGELSEFPPEPSRTPIFPSEPSDYQRFV